MEDIKNYTILTLKKMARQNNYTGYTKMNKLDLYNFLNSKNIDNTSILQPIKGIPKPLDKKKKKTWEEVQRDINYAEFMAYDKFEPNVKIHNHALKQAYVTYRISGIDGGSIENYMKNAKNTVEKIMSSITMTNYKIQLILWTEWFINDDESDIKKAINSRMIAVYPTSENVYNELSNFILNQILIFQVVDSHSKEYYIWMWIFIN